MKRLRRFFTLHACAIFVAFSHPAIAAESYASGNSVAAQRDGKIVVAGSADVGGVDQFALVRYNSDGSLDTSFNSNGKVTTAVGTGTCKGEGVALQQDGKIVVVGYSFNAGGQSCFTVLRYGADGNLDTSFGDSGKVTTAVAKESNAESVGMQSDGKIVVAGNAFIDGKNNDFGLVRYNANGKLDSSFNQTGKAIADFGAQDLPRSVAVHGDGRIVVAGYTANESKKQCGLACFTANGSLDASFNGTGKVTTDFGGEGDAEGQGVAVQTDGRIVVAGYATVAGLPRFATTRYNANGSLDASFGGNGRVLTAVGLSGSSATGVALQKDGKIVVAGYAVNSSGRIYDFACLRYNADGSLDQSFGDHGLVTTDVGDGKASSLTVQDNKTIVAGSAYDDDNNEFAVVRYNASGKLDTSFNSAGSVLTAVGSKPPEAEEDTTPRVSMAVISDPDGYTNVRDYDGKVVAKVKKGEHFIAAKPSGPPQSPLGRKSQHDEPKWSVCLKSGITGFMDKNRIHLLPDELLMKLNHDASKKEWRKFQSTRDTELGDTASVAKGHGLDYYKVLIAASNGDKKALAQFFSLADSMDGAAAEGYFPDASAVFHLVGDKTLSNFVRGLPVADQVGVRGTVMGGLSEEEFANGADVNYLQRYFPETTKLLFRGEIVDWTSPDGRYSIRKTFTDPLHLAESKVSHAELIEKATGQTLCDLTNADIGVGRDREGSVLWSPDSKRFAYVASDLSPSINLFRKAAAPPQKTQTTVYQNLDKSFTKIDLPFDQPPGKENDPEMKGAVMGHEFVTPVRWADANTLILERHDYYERLMPPAGSVHGFDRLYEITVSFKADRTANTSWKLRKDR
jgi:uncharacterized delta-60 repeat protein